MTELLSQRSLPHAQRRADLDQLFKARMKMIQETTSVVMAASESRSNSPIQTVTKSFFRIALVFYFWNPAGFFLNAFLYACLESLEQPDAHKSIMSDTSSLDLAASADSLMLSTAAVSIKEVTFDQI
jgi:hypothetical protein